MRHISSRLTRHLLFVYISIPSFCFCWFLFIYEHNTSHSCCPSLSFFSLSLSLSCPSTTYPNRKANKNKNLQSNRKQPNRVWRLIRLHFFLTDALSVRSRFVFFFLLSFSLLNDSISPSTRNPFACHYTQIDRTRPSINLNKPVSFVIDRVAKRGVGFYPRSITVTWRERRGKIMPYIKVHLLQLRVCYLKRKKKELINKKKKIRKKQSFDNLKRDVSL